MAYEEGVIKSMKKPLILFILLSLLIVTIGCSNKVLYMGSNFGNELKGNYHYFNGTETNTIKLDKGDLLVMNYESTVESGQLVMKLVDPDKKEITSFLEGHSGTYQYKAEKTGKYELQIIGKKTKGNFAFEWEIE